MKSKIIVFLKKDGKYLLIAFLVPVLILAFVYAQLGIYPGSKITVLASDAFSQFSNFYGSFNNMLHGEQNLFYTWNASLGMNYYSLISYYLGGIFTPLVCFFKNSQIPDFLYFLTLLKIGLASISFWVYSKNSFKIAKWLQVAFSISYSLMAFTTAQSELIMWLDTFIYLPLIILGINRIIEKNKPILLFISYFLLFITNFYFGFIVGVFSLLYYFAKLCTDWKTNKKSLFMYFFTSLLAGMASMVMVLPAILDLQANGETLSTITNFKTEATGFWDIIAKNMIGVFDTTKYGSIPFIYIGLFPLLLCLFYFITPKIKKKEKWPYLALFAIIIASFYIEPLNLFWHGMHAPNMFLFRYSFIFSFLVITLAGYGAEKLTRQSLDYLICSSIILSALFAVAKFLMPKGQYTYITTDNLYISILFIALYAFTIIYHLIKPKTYTSLAVVLLILMSSEALINTNAMINGVKEDWNYPSRALYSKPMKNYQAAVDASHKENGDTFYRLESLDPISANDSFNYGFSGISQFSSIRNRHAAATLNKLGYRSRGTSLNIRYQNNTLMMDALMGIRHNLAKGNPLKYGFSEVYQNPEYRLYENENALPLGVATNQYLYKTKLPENDNLSSQTNLYNQLANEDLQYYTYLTPNLTDSSNVIINTNKQTEEMTLSEETPNQAKELTWNLTVPAGKQAYLSIFPTDFSLLKTSTATVSVNGHSFKNQIDITGQYYNLGNYENEENITFSVKFYGTPTIKLIEPIVILLDTDKFQQATDQIQQNKINFKTTGRTTSADVNFKEDQVVFTTIPFEKGWKAYIDGKEVKIKPYDKAFITFSVPKGYHKIELNFFPYGLKLGIILFIIANIIFWGYHFLRWYFYRYSKIVPKS